MVQMVVQQGMLFEFSRHEVITTGLWWLHSKVLALLHIVHFQKLFLPNHPSTLFKFSTCVAIVLLNIEH